MVGKKNQQDLAVANQVPLLETSIHRNTMKSSTKNQMRMLLFLSVLGMLTCLLLPGIVHGQAPSGVTTSPSQLPAPRNAPGNQLRSRPFPGQTIPGQGGPTRLVPNSIAPGPRVTGGQLGNPGFNNQGREAIPSNLQTGQNFPSTRPAINNTQLQIRIKDITTIEGHRSNRLTGIGLITGLKGTGGKEELTQRLAANMLQNFDIRLDEIPSGSMSVVAVTAEIPPFSRPGEKVTATVSTMDNASGLFGGVLQLTQLRGHDNQVYAVAGGSLVLSGFSAEGAAGTITKNHDTTGKVDAQVEVAIEEEPAFPGQSFRLLLTNKDYATAHRIVEQINRYYPGHATALDQGTVDVYFPREYINSKFAFVVKVNELRVVPDIPARVVINQKTGTIVIGQNVKLSRIMFANENLIITTNEAPVAVQPAPFSQGETAILPRTQLTTNETGGSYNIIDQQATVGELASLLNRLGVSPRDMIGIFESIRDSGALQAQLIIQ